MQVNLNRREFIKRIPIVSGSAILAGLYIKGCKSSEQPDPCSDLSGLTEEEKNTRKEFAYVSKSPYPEKVCDNCELWIAPKEGSLCGGCEVMEGPVDPKGYCTVWAAKEES